MHLRTLEIYELNPAKFLSVPGSAWSSALKKTKVKWDFLTGIDIFLMVAKGIGGGICNSIIDVYIDVKYMKVYDKNKETPYIQYWDVNNLLGWEK